MVCCPPSGRVPGGYGLPRGVPARVPGLGDGDFAAHALLAAVRADLAEHLAGDRGVDRGVDREQMRAGLAAFTARVLGV
ncbi:hypothetical protein [Streptomyces flaveolus]|uniref:hypothetical protein n=1 Tax=Streptomyces flaveolus TaxID=67297 RepID=UPI003F53FAC0